MPEEVGASASAMRGYVLAGGRSSRMGVDKGELRLGGQTLLEIAAAKLRPVCAEVAVVGREMAAGWGMRGLPDGHPGCGPLGGIEVVLRDLVAAGGCWGAVLPVDMPLLPPGLLRALVEEWTERGGTGMRWGTVEVDGWAQPLVSVVHRELLAGVERALGEGELRVGPVLEGVARSLAGERGVCRIALRVDGMREGLGIWGPSAGEWEARANWFSNLNTPEEFARAERVVTAMWPQR